MDALQKSVEGARSKNVRRSGARRGEVHQLGARRRGKQQDDDLASPSKTELYQRASDADIAGPVENDA